MEAVFSIRPQYASKILSGEKRAEFRRNICVKPIEKILIYSTSPISCIVGEVSVVKIIVDSVEAVWQLTKEYAGLEYKEYFQYFSGRYRAVAYILSNPVQYLPPLNLSDVGVIRAPQSFCYLPGYRQI